jgi:adenosylcobalamin-dependent ribonucleoside-triphosphate reductase
VEARSEVVIRRTYSRPIDEANGVFETWADICARVRSHQKWLWEQARKGESLTEQQEQELDAFQQLMLDKKVSVSGRTLWLGGTDIAKRRQASQFNCAYTDIETVYDLVDVLWLLMQGTGIGFKPITGTLNGFFKPIKDIQIIRTTRTDKGGRETNEEHYNPYTKTWTLSIGDSAEAWSKSIGKLLAGKYPADKLILDFSQLRPAGSRLLGYGWISSGDEAISKAYLAICKIMNRKAGELLSRIDILDIVNWLGTILSSRRSAQIALFEYGQPEWQEFSTAKRNYWESNIQRGQSNNSLVFYSKPSREELAYIFELMQDSGGRPNSHCPYSFNANQACNHTQEKIV